MKEHKADADVVCTREAAVDGGVVYATEERLLYLFLYATRECPVCPVSINTPDWPPFWPALGVLWVVYPLLWLRVLKVVVVL